MTSLRPGPGGVRPRVAQSPSQGFSSQHASGRDPRMDSASQQGGGGGGGSGSPSQQRSQRLLTVENSLFSSQHASGRDPGPTSDHFHNAMSALHEENARIRVKLADARALMQQLDMEAKLETEKLCVQRATSRSERTLAQLVTSICTRNIRKLAS